MSGIYNQNQKTGAFTLPSAGMSQTTAYRGNYEWFVTACLEELMDAVRLGPDRVYLTQKQEEEYIVMDCRKTDFKTEHQYRIHVKELYEAYSDGCSMADIIEKVVQTLKMINEMNGSSASVSLLDYAFAKDRLFFRLLPAHKLAQTEKQGEGTCPDHEIYRTTGDIALVLYLLIENDGKNLVSMKVTEQQTQAWGMDIDEIWDHAMQNTLCLAAPRIYFFDRDFLDPEYQGEDIMKLDHLDSASGGYCLSTTTRTNGAVAAFLPGVARKISELFGEDFYLAFTSKHEVMIHRTDFINPGDLEEILKDTIREATQPMDYLTETIYRYDRAADQIVPVKA